MSRPIIGLHSPASTREERKTAPTAPVDLRARLGVKRSANYVELCSAALDAGAHSKDEAKTQELLDAIASEFPEVSFAELPQGIVAKCYLGNAYEVHTLDWALCIVTHYKRGQRLPAGLERARILALHPDYAFVEVYGGELRPVSRDGRVTTVLSSQEA
jgi:hypothetical protein